MNLLKYSILSGEGYIKTLVENVSIKTILALPMVFFSYPLLELSSLFILIIIDMVLGILISKKNGNFISFRLRDTIVKTFTYIIILIGAFLLEVIIEPIYETTYVTLFFLAMMAITEFISIIENLIALDAPFPKKEIYNYLRTNGAPIPGIGELFKDFVPEQKNKNIETILNKYIYLVEDENIRNILYIYIITFKIVVLDPFNEFVKDEKDTNSIKTKMLIKDFEKQYGYNVHQKGVALKNVKKVEKIHEQKVNELNQEVEKVIDKNLDWESSKNLILILYINFLYNVVNAFIDEQ